MLAPPYDWLIPVAAAPFVGSFLAILAVRLPVGEDVVAGRSHCRHCGHALAAYELIPVASWAALQGKCSHCSKPIGLIYPAVEMFALVLAVWASTLMSGAMLWLTVALGWTLLALAAMDLRALVLSDLLTLPLIAAGLIVTLAVEPSRLLLHVAGAGAGFALMALVALAYRKLRGRDGLGAGDAKLMSAAGAWVGLEGLGSVLLYAAAAGLAFALVVRTTGGAIDAETEVPLGVGIAGGLWLVWLYGPLVLSL